MNIDGPGHTDSTPWHQAARLSADWRLAAACRDIDPELFFPIGEAGPAVTQIAEAKRVCLTCPVRTPCLGWALKNYQDFGIWGGMTEPERHALRSAITRSRRRSA